MKNGYILWNQTSYGDGYEIFGVYRSLEKAEQMLAKVKKARYGKMTEEEIADYESENGESIRLTYFEDTNGTTYQVETE